MTFRITAAEKRLILSRRTKKGVLTNKDVITSARGWLRELSASKHFDDFESYQSFIERGLSGTVSEDLQRAIKVIYALSHDLDSYLYGLSKGRLKDFKNPRIGNRSVKVLMQHKR
jgi:hypothetical protein